MLVCGVITFAIRYSFIAAEGHFQPPTWFVRLLPFVPVAALTALVAPELLLVDGGIELGGGNARLWAGMVAIVAAVLVAQHRAYHRPRLRLAFYLLRRRLMPARVRDAVCLPIRATDARIPTEQGKLTMNSPQPAFNTDPPDLLQPWRRLRLQDRARHPFRDPARFARPAGTQGIAGRHRDQRRCGRVSPQ
jgi:branched-subunit amino acid transport protein